MSHPVRSPEDLSASYQGTIRVLIRFAIVMAVVGLLAGLAYRESAKKLTFEAAGPGLHLEAVLGLALFHGHVFTTGVLLPLVLAGALTLSRRVGGREVGRLPLLALTRLCLPFTVATLVLQLVRGYHVLLAVRGGATDLAAVDATYLGGSHVLRYVLYGAAHTGMAVGLIVFLVALWRSLGKNAAA